jgi:hypothetical protein
MLPEIIRAARHHVKWEEAAIGTSERVKATQEDSHMGKVNIGPFV